MVHGLEVEIGGHFHVGAAESQDAQAEIQELQGHQWDLGGALWRKKTDKQFSPNPEARVPRGTVAPQLERLSARDIDDSLVHGTQKEMEVHFSDVHTMGWCKPRTRTRVS